jgi:hypothetical protein
VRLPAAARAAWRPLLPRCESAARPRSAGSGPQGPPAVRRGAGSPAPARCPSASRPRAGRRWRRCCRCRPPSSPASPPADDVLRELRLLRRRRGAGGRDHRQRGERDAARQPEAPPVTSWDRGAVPSLHVYLQAAASVAAASLCLQTGRGRQARARYIEQAAARLQRGRTLEARDSCQRFGPAPHSVPADELCETGSTFGLPLLSRLRRKLVQGMTSIMQNVVLIVCPPTTAVARRDARRGVVLRPQRERAFAGVGDEVAEPQVLALMVVLDGEVPGNRRPQIRVEPGQDSTEIGRRRWGERARSLSRAARRSAPVMQSWRMRALRREAVS